MAELDAALVLEPVPVDGLGRGNGVPPATSGRPFWRLVVPSYVRAHRDFFCTAAHVSARSRCGVYVLYAPACRWFASHVACGDLVEQSVPAAIQRAGLGNRRGEPAGQPSCRDSATEHTILPDLLAFFTSRLSPSANVNRSGLRFGMTKYG